MKFPDKAQALVGSYSVDFEMEKTVVITVSMKKQ